MKRILIVDQSERRGEALSNFMRNEGFEIGVANTATMALSALATASPLPSFILLDVKLLSEDNWVLSEKIKNNYPEVSVILMADESVAEVEHDGDFDHTLNVGNMLELCQMLGQQ